MGADETGGTELAAFIGTIAAPKPEKSNSRRRNHGGDGAEASTESGQPEGAARNGSSEGETRRVLSQITQLAGDERRYDKLERWLWENVDNIVPSVMSLNDWTKVLRELRESNLIAKQKSGEATEDPLAEIRRFLQ